jgi:hypothetical protein
VTSFYDDSKYGVIERTWFGLTRKLGGACASGFTLGSGTTEEVVTRFYPKGPIEVTKVGVMALATLASAANATGSVDRQRLPVHFYKSNATGTKKSTLIASTHVIMGDGGRTARYGIASNQAPASAEVEAGRYITIYLASANSDNGSAMGDIGTVLRTGTLAMFIDWKRRYGNDWED